jgi:hypothetical protein
MPRFKHPLNHVRLSSPCKADWDQMIGSERTRFCGQCNLNVYNLSGMTRDEAESLIARNERRLCVRFYRRVDGSIITQDCPVGLRAIHERVSYWTRAIGVAALTFLAAAGFSRLLPAFGSAVPQRTMGVMAVPYDGVLPVQGALPPEPNVAPLIGKMVLKPSTHHIKSK